MSRTRAAPSAPDFSAWAEGLREAASARSSSYLEGKLGGYQAVLDLHGDDELARVPLARQADFVGELAALCLKRGAVGACAMEFVRKLIVVDANKPVLGRVPGLVRALANTSHHKRAGVGCLELLSTSGDAGLKVLLCGTKLVVNQLVRRMVADSLPDAAWTLANMAAYVSEAKELLYAHPGLVDTVLNVAHAALDKPPPLKTRPVFKPFKTRDASGSITVFSAITFVPFYDSVSFEELRLEHCITAVPRFLDPTVTLLRNMSFSPLVREQMGLGARGSSVVDVLVRVLESKAASIRASNCAITTLVNLSKVAPAIMRDNSRLVDQLQRRAARRDARAALLNLCYVGPKTLPGSFPEALDLLNLVSYPFLHHELLVKAILREFPNQLTRKENGLTPLARARKAKLGIVPLLMSCVRDEAYGYGLQHIVGYTRKQASEADRRRRTLMMCLGRLAKKRDADLSRVPAYVRSYADVLRGRRRRVFRVRSKDVVGELNKVKALHAYMKGGGDVWSEICSFAF